MRTILITVGCGFPDFNIISTVLDENSARNVQRSINTACVEIESSAWCVQWKTQHLSSKSTVLFYTAIFND